MAHELGAALVARRLTVQATCQLDGCSETFTTRLRRPAKGAEPEPERRYCSNSHRLKADYQRHREERRQRRPRRADQGGQGG